MNEAFGRLPRGRRAAMRQTGASPCRESIEEPQQHTEDEVGEQDRYRRLDAIVEREEPGWLELPHHRGAMLLAGHSWVESRQEPHPGGEHEGAMDEADRSAAPPGG